MGYLITLHIKQIASKICVSSENLALACQVMSNLHLWILKKYISFKIVLNIKAVQMKIVYTKSLFRHCLDTFNLSGEQGKKH